MATGTAPVAGPWQLEVWRSHGGPSPPGEPRGRCLFIQRLDPGDPSGLTGFCGGLGFRKTPGFSRAELSVPRPGRRFVEELIVYGRVPERARAVVVTPERGSKVMVEPEEGPKSVPGDFFVIPLKPEQAPARINWLDHDGSPGSPRHCGAALAACPPLPLTQPTRFASKERRGRPRRLTPAMARTLSRRRDASPGSRDLT